MFDVRVSGPLFDGTAPKVIEDMKTEVLDALGVEGLAGVQMYMDRYFRNPTPYYETQVISERVASDRVKIHDRGIIYGAWLDGSGSRNAVTRFKGYSHWREATQDLERKAPQVMQPIVDRHLDRLR